MVYLIISSCTKKKDDSTPIEEKIVTPSYYLDERQARIFEEKRKLVFRDPKSSVGDKETYAFDLYVKTGKAYKELYRKNYVTVKNTLLKNNIVEWFFLSGGYGIIHALEKARKYQATFNRNIAYQNRIPYTTNIWLPILPKLIDSIIQRFEPEYVYVFGSKDYTMFIKKTKSWLTKNNIKIFESYGSSGPHWISTILNELVTSIIKGNVDEFNSKYTEKIIKQK